MKCLDGGEGLTANCCSMGSRPDSAEALVLLRFSVRRPSACVSCGSRSVFTKCVARPMRSRSAGLDRRFPISARYSPTAPACTVLLSLSLYLASLA